MGRPKKDMDAELKAAIAQDIAANKKRGVICKERGVSYQQLQNHFGFTCRKPRAPKAEPVAPATDGWPKAESAS